MQLNITRRYAGVIVLLILIVLTATALAQGTREDTVSSTLVSELRQLRVAIENLTLANSRIQVLSVRATQQEQRLSSITGQLLPLKLKLAEASTETIMITSQLEKLRELHRFESDPKIRAELELEQRGLVSLLEEKRLKQAALQEQVSDLTQQAMNEQSKLTDVQQRLDDLEKLLSPRRQ